MTKRRRLELIAGVIMTLVVFAFIVAPGELNYQGRPLRDWLKDIKSPNSSVQTNSLENLAALNAIREMDGDAVPFLIRMLKSEDAWWKLRWNKFAQDHSWVRYRFEKAQIDHRLALNGLWALGPAAEPALPILQNRFRRDHDSLTGLVLAAIGHPAMPVLSDVLLNSTNVLTRFAALNVVGWEMPTNCTESVISLLVKSIATETNHGLRIYAARRLAELHTHENLVVPLLLEGMKFPENDTRADSARALLNFPESARKHLPEIRKLAEDHDVIARNGALDILRELGETDK